MRTDPRETGRASFRRMVSVAGLLAAVACAPAAYETSTRLQPHGDFRQTLDSATAVTLQGRGYQRLAREVCGRPWLFCYERREGGRRDVIHLALPSAGAPSDPERRGVPMASDVEIRIAAWSYRYAETVRPEGPALTEVTWTTIDPSPEVRGDADALRAALRRLGEVRRR